MRAISEAMAAQLAAGVSTHAHVWRVTRRDNEVFAFTDHDRALALDDLICEPFTGVGVGAMEKSVGLGVDTASLTGALNSEAITEDDLARGLWDGARVDVYRVDWSDPVQRVHLFAGHLGEVRRGASAFEAELRGLQAALNVPVGRVFSRYCDADLGDGRCAKDIETSSFRGEGVVSEPVSEACFRVAGLESFADGWFARGRLIWSDGGESEVLAHRAEAEAALLELREAPGIVVDVGPAFTVYAGCDKRFETCRAKFANSGNFRGFPHMPGNDAVISGPIAGQTLDGSSRYT